MQTRELAEIYRRIRELPTAAREAALDAACGDDFMARARISKLLRNVKPPSRAELLGADPFPEFIGEYRLLRMIGRGGMGTVYEAVKSDGTRVAVKVLRGGPASDDLLQRFEREAQILRRLDHPCIARIHFAGSTETGRPYIVMGLVEGRTVTGHARGITAEGRVEIMARICDAVEHAHCNGVVHRDLKPGNVLITPDGQPMVLDFGIARSLDGDSYESLDGTIMGTAAYMSPEQALGLDIDRRADIFALGLIAHEVFVGKHPAADLHGTQHLAALIAPDGLPCTVPGDLGAIIRRAIATERDDRFERARDFGRALRLTIAPHLAR